MAHDSTQHSPDLPLATASEWDQAREFLRNRGLLPSPESVTCRGDSFDKFCDLVLGQDAHRSYHGSKETPDACQYRLRREGDIKFVIAQVGSFGLGVWNEDDPMVCVCFGSTNVEEFALVLEQNLKAQADPRAVNVKRAFDEDGESLTAEACINGVPIKLEYCYLGSYFMAKWEEMSVAITQDPVISSSAIEPLNAFRDSRRICESVPRLDEFRIVYRLLELWVRSRGIYHTSLGYLDRKVLVLLLYGFWKQHQQDNSSLHSTLLGFFAHYSSMDWRKDVITSSSDPKLVASFAHLRTKQRPAVVLSLFPPVVNAAARITEQSLRVILNEFEQAKCSLQGPPVSWTTTFDGQLLEKSEEVFSVPPQQFIKNFRLFVKFEVQYWGTDVAGKARFLDQMRTQYLIIADRLSRTNFQRFIVGKQNAMVFAWPYCLLRISSAKDEEKFCYLIGISNGGDATGYQSFLTDLEDECAEIAADFQRDHIFDPLTAFAQVSVVNRTSLGELEWISEETSPAARSVKEAMSPAERKVLTQAYVTSNDSVATKKLRSASEVLNRLIWDSTFDRSDYIIGYLDRFLGVLEIPLDSWKVDSSDREFIPQHRILYFKKKSDNQVMWDRKSRIDRIFDSEDIQT